MGVWGSNGPLKALCVGSSDRGEWHGPFPKKLFWRTGPFRSPNLCSVVVIGRKYLDKISQVMDVVDGISEYLQMMPYATFLMTNGEELENLVDITLRHNISPLMVLCQGWGMFHPLTFQVTVPVVKHKAGGFRSTSFCHEENYLVKNHLLSDSRSCVQECLSVWSTIFSSTRSLWSIRKVFSIGKFENLKIFKGIHLDDICKKKKMNLGFNQHPVFKVDEKLGETIKFPVRPTKELWQNNEKKSVINVEF